MTEVKSEAEVREKIAANERVVLFFGKVGLMQRTDQGRAVIY